MPERAPHPEPPPPPELRPRLRLTAVQLIGMCIIAAVPVMALLGLFGQTSGSGSGSSASIRLDVKYPTRYRFKTIDVVEATVTNTSKATIDRISVSFDPQYIASFSNVFFTPQPQRAYVVDLQAVQPGEQRLVSVEIQAEKYGHHTGEVVASTERESAAVRISTFVFP